MESRVQLGPGKFHVVVLVMKTNAKMAQGFYYVAVF